MNILQLLILQTEAVLKREMCLISKEIMKVITFSLLFTGT